MAVLSAIFYFLSHHSILSIPLILLTGFGLVSLVAMWRKNASLYGWMLAVFLFAMVNVFTGSIWNGLFLNAVGTYGSAVITQERETNSRLNEQAVWAYDVVMKTADGRDVKTGFDTMSATIYPWTNTIYIPPVGERFVIKYVPGFERNIAVMRLESDYGKKYIVAVAMGEVSAKERQLEASPDNPQFKAEYRAALQEFLTDHSKDASPSVVDRYRRTLQALGGTIPESAKVGSASGAAPAHETRPVQTGQKAADCRTVMPPELYAKHCSTGQCNCTSSSIVTTTQTTGSATHRQ